ncbi:MAG: hypothetical protein A2Z34_09680 [Planctomycetes bacterium RBG_16_59_8]|nr:MAG: hypothetical protein A2Z34_09680 [Planctomycetes bacterium RBG_16_59_8]
MTKLYALIMGVLLLAGAAPEPATLADVDLQTFSASAEALCYLAAGSTAEKGEYAPKIRSALDIVLRNVGSPDFTRSGRSAFIAPFAPIFLAELLHDKEKLADPALRTKAMEILQRAVALIEAGQKEGIGEAHGTEGSGAWGYSIAEGKNEGRRKAQGAVCCLIALLAARDAGAKVSEAALTKGTDYLMRCVGPTGEVGYQGTATDGKYAGYGRTAGALYIMKRMGKEKSVEYQRALKWLDAQKVDKDYEAHAGAFQAWGFVWGGLFHAIRGGSAEGKYFTYAGKFFKDVVKPDGTWNGKDWVLKETTLNPSLTNLSLLGQLLRKGNITVLTKVAK